MEVVKGRCGCPSHIPAPKPRIAPSQSIGSRKVSETFKADFKTLNIQHKCSNSAKPTLSNVGSYHLSPFVLSDFLAHSNSDGGGAVTRKPGGGGIDTLRVRTLDEIMKDIFTDPKALNWDQKVNHYPVLRVGCNGQEGYLHKALFVNGQRGQCISYHGGIWTPSEFEFAAGFGSRTKWTWKYSIIVEGYPLGLLIKNYALPYQEDFPVKENWDEILAKHLGPSLQQVAENQSIEERLRMQSESGEHNKEEDIHAFKPSQLDQPKTFNKWSMNQLDSFELLSLTDRQSDLHWKADSLHISIKKELKEEVVNQPGFIEQHNSYFGGFLTKKSWEETTGKNIRAWFEQISIEKLQRSHCHRFDELPENVMPYVWVPGFKKYLIIPKKMILKLLNKAFLPSTPHNQQGYPIQVLWVFSGSRFDVFSDKVVGISSGFVEHLDFIRNLRDELVSNRQ